MDQLTLTCENRADLSNISSQILDFLDDIRLITFSGELGAGKTTLIKELCKNLGVVDNTSSPTFSIVNQYRNHDQWIFHMDFYRIKDVEEALEAGVEEYLFSDHICMVEWPDVAKELLPDDRVDIQIKVTGSESRVFELKKNAR